MHRWGHPSGVFCVACFCRDHGHRIAFFASPARRRLHEPRVGAGLVGGVLGRAGPGPLGHDLPGLASFPFHLAFRLAARKLPLARACAQS